VVKVGNAAGEVIEGSSGAKFEPIRVDESGDASKHGDIGKIKVKDQFELVQNLSYGTQKTRDKLEQNNLKGLNRTQLLRRK
jgi:hypothetical protein